MKAGLLRIQFGYKNQLWKQTYKNNLFFYKLRKKKAIVNLKL